MQLQSSNNILTNCQVIPSEELAQSLDKSNLKKTIFYNNSVISPLTFLSLENLVWLSIFLKWHSYERMAADCTNVSYMYFFKMGLPKRCTIPKKVHYIAKIIGVPLHTHGL